jgi:hypothetical protein
LTQNTYNINNSINIFVYHFGEMHKHLYNEEAFKRGRNDRSEWRGIYEADIYRSST